MNGELKIGDKVRVLYEKNLHIKIMVSLNSLKHFIHLIELYGARIVSIDKPYCNVGIIDMNRTFWFREEELEKVLSNNEI